MSAYETFKQGRYSGQGILPRKVVGSKNGPFGFIPQLSSGIEDWIYQIDACNILPVAADSTITVTNSGAIAIVAAGLQLTTGATSTNNTTIQQIRSIVPATGKRFAMAFRKRWTVVAKGTSVDGLTNTAAAPIATPPTDGLWFSKDTAGTGAIMANLMGASTLATPVAVHTAVLDTDYEYGLLYTPIDATNGIAQFWQRAADAEGWGTPITITAASGKGIANALRRTLNLNATDSNALTSKYAWIATAYEL